MIFGLCSKRPPRQDAMTAFVILALRSAEQVLQLISSIYTRLDYYAVHMDAKTPVEELQRLRALSAQKKNILIVESTLCAWGSFSLVRAELAAIEILLKYPDWEHLVLLSEQHYPVKHRSEFDTILETNTSYMDVNAFVEINPISRADIKHRFARYYVEFPGVGSFAAGCRNIDLSHIYHASQWAVLCRRAAEYLISSFCREHQLWQDFEKSLLPDEIAFPTVLMNASETDRGRVSGQCLTYVAWPHLTDNNDLIASKATFENARKSSSLFIRKRPAALSDFAGFEVRGEERIETVAKAAAGAKSAHLETSISDLKRLIQSRVKDIEIRDCSGDLNAATVFFQLRKPQWTWRLSIMLISHDNKSFKMVMNAGPGDGSLAEISLGPYRAHVMKVRLIDMQGCYQVDVGRDHDEPLELSSRQSLKSFLSKLDTYISIGESLDAASRSVN